MDTYHNYQKLGFTNFATADIFKPPPYSKLTANLRITFLFGWCFPHGGHSVLKLPCCVAPTVGSICMLPLPGICNTHKQILYSTLTFIMVSKRAGILVSNPSTYETHSCLASSVDVSCVFRLGAGTFQKLLLLHRRAFEQLPHEELLTFSLMPNATKSSVVQRLDKFCHQEAASRGKRSRRNISSGLATNAD